MEKKNLNNESANKSVTTAQPVGNVVKATVEAAKEKAVKAPMQVVKPAEAERQAAKLQEEIDRKAAELQKCLTELARKQELSKHRSAFLLTLDQLEAAEEKLRDTDNFDTPVCKLKFFDATSYRDSEVFSIGNRELLLDFIAFIRSKIADRVKRIEDELMA